MRMMQPCSLVEQTRGTREEANGVTFSYLLNSTPDVLWVLVWWQLANGIERRMEGCRNMSRGRSGSCSSADVVRKDGRCDDSRANLFVTFQNSIRDSSSSSISLMMSLGQENSKSCCQRRLPFAGRDREWIGSGLLRAKTRASRRPFSGELPIPRGQNDGKLKAFFF